MFTFREEFTARIWATGYDFPAVPRARSNARRSPERTPVRHAGLVLQHRAATKFEDPRIREAIGLAFDFEWTNANVMYGAYYAHGVLFRELGPEGRGPALARRSWRCSSRSAAGCRPRSSASPSRRRSRTARARTGTLLRRADELLREAGCRRDGSVLKLPSGEPLAIEFLDYQPIAAAAHAALHPQSRRCSASTATSRIVDAAQYQRRTEEFDFDMIVPARYPASPTPGEACGMIFGSEAAPDAAARYNIAGIADPAVDALVEAIVAAETRAGAHGRLPGARPRAAGRAAIGCPMWYQAPTPVAYWDMFGRPAEAAGLRSRRAGDLVVRRREGEADRARDGEPTPDRRETRQDVGRDRRRWPPISSAACC